MLDCIELWHNLPSNIVRSRLTQVHSVDGVEPLDCSVELRELTSGYWVGHNKPQKSTSRVIQVSIIKISHPKTPHRMRIKRTRTVRGVSHEVEPAFELDKSHKD